MFKWPGTPSPRAPVHELADLPSWSAGGGHSTSTTELSADLGRLDENDYLDGVPEEDEEVEVANLAFVEIERRREACRDGYPYVVGKHGYSLSVDETAQDHRHIVYRYLLLATRLNMSDNRMHAGVDGTVLMEQLAAEVAREYLGLSGLRVLSLVPASPRPLSRREFETSAGRSKRATISRTATRRRRTRRTADLMLLPGSTSPTVYQASLLPSVSARQEPTTRTRWRSSSQTRSAINGCDHLLLFLP